MECKRKKPEECFTCPFRDCVSETGFTRQEAEYLRIGKEGIADSRGLLEGRERRKQAKRYYEKHKEQIRQQKLI